MIDAFGFVYWTAMIAGLITMTVELWVLKDEFKGDAGMPPHLLLIICMNVFGAMLMAATFAATVLLVGTWGLVLRGKI